MRGEMRTCTILIQHDFFITLYQYFSVHRVAPEFVCPAGFTKFGGHDDCYHTRALPAIDWYTARDYCTDLGSHLVTVETDAELAIIQDYLNCEFCFGFIVDSLEQ